MRRSFFAGLLLLAASFTANAATRVIVRTNRGLQPLKTVCALLGCNVVRPLDGTIGKVFLVTVPSLPLNLLQLNLSIWLGPIGIELDTNVSVYEQAPSGPAPAALSDRTPIDYFGSTVWNGYAHQPATGIIRLGAAQQEFSVYGAGVVAVIDTGVDRNHPALASVLLPGYDFVNNVPQVPDEDQGEVTQSVSPVLDGPPIPLNLSTLAVLDSLDIPLLTTLTSIGHRGFGHGTMVSGVVHMVAPAARIMPLRAFEKDGNGYLSDIIRAVYYAADQHANVVNMSFSIGAQSTELNQALDYAAGRGTILVAAAGNNGNTALVWPAAAASVMGVASTDYVDHRSSFSNYGSALVWVAAPGESIVTTYPFGTYASATGTSFSAPMVAGTIALLFDAGWNPTPAQAAEAVSHARYPSPELGNGRLDVHDAVLAWILSQH